MRSNLNSVTIFDSLFPLPITTENKLNSNQFKAFLPQHTLMICKRVDLTEVATKISFCQGWNTTPVDQTLLPANARAWNNLNVKGSVHTTIYRHETGRKTCYASKRQQLNFHGIRPPR